MCHCLKTCGPNCTCTGRDECSPYLRFFRYGYGSVKRSQKIGIPQNINYCRHRNRSIFYRERKAGVESYVPSSLSKELLFETKLDWKLRRHSSNKTCTIIHLHWLKLPKGLSKHFPSYFLLHLFISLSFYSRFCSVLFETDRLTLLQESAVASPTILSEKWVLRQQGLLTVLSWMANPF